MGECSPNPAILTGNVVTAWLRNTTIGALSSWPDVLNPGNPAVPRNVAPTGNADGSISLNGTTQSWSWAPAASNFNVTRTGVAFWLKAIDFAVSPAIFTMRTGGFVFQIAINGSGNTIGMNMVAQSGLRRDATSIGSAFTTNTPAFFTWEYDGGQSTDATICVITVNGTPVAFNYSGGLSIMPATLHSTTNPIDIGSNGTSQLFHGAYGRNLFTLQGAGGISGGGLLTSAQRTALMNFEPLS